jgi:hypothetical protein
MGMEWLMTVSERTGDLITGTVEPNGTDGLNTEQLTEWYKRLGFTVKNGTIVYYPTSLY